MVEQVEGMIWTVSRVEIQDVVWEVTEEALEAIRYEGDDIKQAEFRQK